MNWNDAIQQLAETHWKTDPEDVIGDDPFAKFFEEAEKDPRYWQALAELEKSEMIGDVDPEINLQKKKLTDSKT